MIPTNPYVWAVILAVGLGYYTTEKVKTPVEHAAKHVCHVVTLGHKCKTPTVQP